MTESNSFEIGHLVLDNKRFGLIISHKDPKLIEAIELKIKEWIKK